MIYDLTANMTTVDLKKKIHEVTGVEPEKQRLVFSGKELNGESLGEAGIKANSTVLLLVRLKGGTEKKLTKDYTRENGIKLTDNPDIITLETDPEEPRAEMPCGHAITAASLTQWARSYITNGLRIDIRCPNSQGSGATNCAPWPYTLVRQIAMLTDDECEFFEVKLSKNFISTMGCVECPKCRTLCFNPDQKMQQVACEFCRMKKQNFNFCVKCLKPWESLGKGCKTCLTDPKHVNEILSADFKINVGQKILNVPKYRSCPRSDLHQHPVLVEHNGDGCKHLTCPSCHKDFCLVCLTKKTDQNSWPTDCGGAWDMCKKAIAPSQRYELV